MQTLFGSILVTQWSMIFSWIVFLILSVQVFQHLKGDRPFFRTVLPIILLGLALRIFWILFTQPIPTSDFQLYWNLAQSLHHGDLSYPNFMNQPALPILDSFLMQFLGNTLWTGWILNLFCSLMAMILTYCIAKQLWGYKAALIATVCSATLPQLFSYPALMATETPTIAYLLLWLWFVLSSRTWKQHQSIRWAGLGVILYGLLMLRASTFLLLFIVPITFFFTRSECLKKSLKHCAIMTVTTLILMTPWALRQAYYTGSPNLSYCTDLWLLSTTHYEKPEGYVSPMQSPFYEQVKSNFQSSDPKVLAQGYRILGKMTFNQILQEPGKYLWFGLTRIQNILETSQTGVAWSVSQSRFTPLLRAKDLKHLIKFSNAYWKGLLGICFFGVVYWVFNLKKSGKTMILNLKEQEGFLLMLLFLGSWLIFHYLLSPPAERYQFIIIPEVILIASASLVKMGQAFKHKFFRTNTFYNKKPDNFSIPS